MSTQLPTLGVGIGFREPYRSDVFLHRGKIDFLEITADHFFDASIEKTRELELLADHFTLIPHGLSLSLGSADGLDAGYVKKMAKLVNYIDPPWWSEHIAFTKAGGIEIGHLAPLPFTREAVAAVARNVNEIRRAIEVPLVLENITYMVAMPGAEMSETEFVNEVLEATDCGLLLDVTNLYTNVINHRLDLESLLEKLPWERVVQLHFVGGHEHGGRLIDSHSQTTPPEVWTLLETVLERAAVKGIILERDENLPPFSELLTELEHARDLGRQHKRWT